MTKKKIKPVFEIIEPAEGFQFLQATFERDGEKYALTSPINEHNTEEQARAALQAQIDVS